MNPAFVIAGPTASGKTDVALALAALVDGEIISADAMQVYCGMDIGTAKPTAAQRAAVPHHLLDVAAPHQSFSAAQYQALAQAALADIRGRGKVPIVVGGTGFYINALVYGAQFAPEPAAEAALRQALEAQEPAAVHAQLATHDPAAAAAIPPHNLRRTARALAFCLTTGGLFSEHNAAQRVQRQPVFPAVLCVLDMPRPVLYARINARTHAMFAQGLAQEVAGLLAAGCDPQWPSMQAIGYKETTAWLQEEGAAPTAPPPSLLAAIQQATRRYAKRQDTWFRHQFSQAHVIDATRPAQVVAEDIVQKEAHP